jgi:hypothetical protein
MALSVLAADSYKTDNELENELQQIPTKQRMVGECTCVATIFLLTGGFLLGGT